jgi:hypothetical protein
MYFPGLRLENNPNLLSFALNASTDKLACIIQAPASGDITAVGFLLGTVTTGDDLQIGIETVSTGGDPTGTLFDAGSGARSVETIGDGDDDAWILTSTTSLATTVVKGDLIAVVIEFEDFALSGNLEIEAAFLIQEFPFVNHNASSSWSPSARPPIIALSYGGTFHPIPAAYPFNATAVGAAYSNSSNPDERGNLVRFSSEVSLAGVASRGRIDSSSTDTVAIKVYSDPTGTPSLEESLTLIHDKSRASTGTAGRHYLFDTSITLAANTWYAITFRPSGSANVRLDSVTVDSVAIMDAFQGGADYHWCERNNDAGAFTANTTQRMWFDLIIDQVHDGAGGAGSPSGVRNPLRGPI